MSFLSGGIAVASDIRSRRHEHLYESIEERLIRSDDLFSDPVATERKLGGSRTILSTISMLSNPALDDNGVYRIVPVERLVVDEASQIDSFELMVSSCFVCRSAILSRPHIHSTCSTSSKTWRKSACSAIQSSVSRQTLVECFLKR